jgi:hypothetical protein
VTAASPLRGPKSIEGGGCAAAHLRGAPRKATGPLLRPPGRCAFPAEMAFRPPWTPETSAAPGARKSGQAQACPWPGARRAGSRGGQRYPDASERSELAFDNTTRRKNYTNPGQVTSSQQSHLATLLHTKPGVHETRDAPDTLAALRTPYWLGDSAVGLHALASLIAQANKMIPDAVHAARDQGHTWAEIGQLLNLSPAAAARRYRTTT